MKRTLALGGVAAGLLASAIVASPAQADDQIPAINLAKTNFAAQQVAAFWFGEARANLINATPYNVETKLPTKHVSTGGTSASSKAGVVGSSGDQKAATGNLKNVNLPRTVGKVFFIGADHRPHWCSATSVQSGYKNLVATAGHCVYDTVSNKATLDKWVFIPGYYQGKTPWGIYVGKTAYTHYDFDNYEDGDRNYAFVTVYNGVQVTDVSYDKYGRDDHRGRNDHGRDDHRGRNDHDGKDYGRDDHRGRNDHDGKDRGRNGHDDRRSYVKRLSIREFQALNRGRDLTGNGPWAKGTGVETREISERQYNSRFDSYPSGDGKTLYFRKKVWDRDDHKGPRHDDHQGPKDEAKALTPEVAPSGQNNRHPEPSKPEPKPTVTVTATATTTATATATATVTATATATVTATATTTVTATPTGKPTGKPDWCDDDRNPRGSFSGDNDRRGGGRDHCDDNNHRPKYKYYARTFWAKSVRNDHRPHGTLKITLKDVGRLGDNVGGQGLAYNQKIGTNVFVFGYPSGSHPDGNYAFTGQTLKWAYGKTFKVSVPAVKGEELVGVKTSFTGEGSIGSSWLFRYSNTKRLGYLNGVTIGLGDVDGNDRIDTSISSYFDGETLAVYQYAAKFHSGRIV
ncbi:serine protease [Microbispora sp. H13382]|uniref:trypsin-like serine peptidase n=1 Tax=Microbispora sp. H13382 TaxID=2729112 RepID=UPI0021759D37|nr:hypothetical protein [Microbispora sp. H13382]